MPLIIPENLINENILEEEKIFIKTKSNAIKQDIRPLKIAIVNLMPNKEETELQLIKMLSNTALQIELDLITTQSYIPKNTNINRLKSFYKTYSQIKNNKYDAMIITGSPVERLNYNEIKYWDELTQIFEFARKNVYSTMFICWAAQAALKYFYNINHTKLEEKIFGVYKFKKLKDSNLFRGFDDEFYVPQSRYTLVNKKELENIKDLNILSYREDTGLGIATSSDNRFVFSFGHWEYNDNTLEKEYIRDKSKNINSNIPQNYYEDNNINKKIISKWHSSGSLFFSNWLNYYVYQETPFDIKNIKNKIVSKFGGTSLSDSKQFKKVKNIINSSSDRNLIVVSAPGKRFEKDKKITDLLIKLSDSNIDIKNIQDSIKHLENLIHKKLQDNEITLTLIEDRFKEISEELEIKNTSTLIQDTINNIKTSTDKDFVVSRGEYLNANLLAKYLDYDFVDSKNLIVFNEDNTINYKETNERIIKCLNEKDKIVIPGFYGAKTSGEIKTFSRGGSDLTGSIIASAIESETYENWTDVNGIMTENPKINHNAKTIPNLSYDELYNIINKGAEVYQKEAIKPAKNKNITIRILNTNDPNGLSTIIKN